MPLTAARVLVAVAVVRAVAVSRIAGGGVDGIGERHSDEKERSRDDGTRQHGVLVACGWRCRGGDEEAMIGVLATAAMRWIGSYGSLYLVHRALAASRIDAEKLDVGQMPTVCELV